MLVADSTILADVAALLKQGGSGVLSAYWSTVVALQHQAAYVEMLGALAARGWSLAAVAASDQAPVMERLHALYLSLADGGGIEGLSEKVVKSFDQTERFRTVMLTGTVAGVPGSPLIPDLTGPLGPCSAAAQDTSGDTFVWPDPSDPHRGEPTRW